MILKVYEMDFVILCIGKFSDLPNIPDFSSRRLFHGLVLHSMNYAAMDKIQAAKFTQNKRVTVVGFQKSALDTAAEIAKNNGINLKKITHFLSTHRSFVTPRVFAGVKHPCTLLFRRVRWSGSENLVKFTFKNLTRFSELMVHKPAEGLILWFLALLLSPVVTNFLLTFFFSQENLNIFEISKVFVPKFGFFFEKCP